MNKTRAFALVATGIALVGCLSLLSHSMRVPRLGASFGNAGIVGIVEAEPRIRNDDRVEALSESHRELIARYEAVVARTEKMAGEQVALTRRLDEVSAELFRLYEAVSDQVAQVPPPETWQEQMSKKNALRFDEIRKTLISLRDQGFPSALTWYGDDWRQMTGPIVAGQFPTDSQRNRLIQLVGDIMDGERKRVSEIKKHNIILASSSSKTPESGDCLGQEWEELAKNLQDIVY